jgi:hypothetical protein
MESEARTFTVTYLGSSRFESMCALCGWVSEVGSSGRVVDVMVRHIRTKHA